MSPRSSALAAKALVLLATSLLAWNLIGGPETPRHGTPASRDRVATTRDTGPARRVSTGAGSARPADGPAGDRQAARDLADELDAAIAHGVDPEGADARVYAEAIRVLSGEPAQH